MCFSKPKKPTTPDPYVTAQAQAQANIDTARTQTNLNRYNEHTPFGAKVWEQGPNDRWTSTIVLDPETQQAVNTRRSNTLDVERGLQSVIGQAGQTFANPTTGAPTRWDAYKDLQEADSGLYDANTELQDSFHKATQDRRISKDINTRFADTASQNFNYDALGPAPVASDNTRQSVADALYNQATSRLDPRFSQRENDLKTQLAAQGITQGSSAYDREMGNFSRDRNDAYGSATNAATSGSIDAMQKLFGMELAGRQQGVGEANYLRNLPGMEAKLASDLASSSAQNANSTMTTKTMRDSAVPGIAQAMFNLDRSGNLSERGDRRAAIDEINAIRAGNQINTGQYNSDSAAGVVGQTPIANLVNQQTQDNFAKYNSDMGSYNSEVGGAASLASTAALAALVMG